MKKSKGKSKQAKKAKDTSKGQSYIMNIPAEVRGLIYNKLPQKHALKARFVCKQWAKEIFEMFELSIQLDERKTEAMERLRDMKIKNCEVYCFFNPPSMGSRTSFFKYPKFIRRLKINTRMKISPTNFQNLLQECSEYLEELTILLENPERYNVYDEELNEDLMTSYPLRLDSECNFHNLRKLELIDDRNYSEDAPLSESENDTFLRILRNPSISKLKHLRAGWYRFNDGVEAEAGLTFSAAIISLIARQWKTLKIVDVFYDFCSPSDPKNLSIFKMIDTTLWGKVDSLKEIELGFEKQLHAQDVQTINIWSDCLRNQKTLESIIIDHTIRYALFLQVVDANFATLSEVEVELNFQEHTKGPLDISIFKNCKNLQELSLSLDFFERRRTNPLQDIVNLRELPKCIKRLWFQRFEISIEELDAFFSQDQELESLENFQLVGHKRSGEAGMNLSILEKILDLPAILKISIRSTLGFDAPVEYGMFNFDKNNRTPPRYQSLILFRKSIDERFTTSHSARQTKLSSLTLACNILVHRLESSLISDTWKERQSL